MKKFISLMLTLCLCLSLSTVFSYADFTSTDSSNLSDIKSKVNQIYSAMPTYTQISGISSSLTTISNTLSTISSKLTDGNHSVAYLVNSIVSWMNPIYLRLQDILQATTDPAVNAITGLLGFPSTDSSTGVTTWNPYLRDIRNGVTDFGVDLPYVTSDANGNIIFQSVPTIYNWQHSNALMMNNITWELAHFHNTTLTNFNRLLTGETTSQTFVNHLDLTTSTFTPNSTTNGLYTWLSKIQNPVARLSYVLASDERIEAQEAAAAYEEAVVDNFIDSSGSGAASTSDISSVSGLSSGFKDNISTDASVSGIWNIFNSDNFGWFSQETADQLDTTGSNNRTLRSSGSYPTPLLDQQTEDILKYIGGDDND